MGFSHDHYVMDGDQAGGPGAPLVDMISLGVLTSWVQRDDVDTVIALHGKQAKRRGGTLPPRVMAYYPIAMALFGDEDYEGVLRRLTGPLRRMPGCWDPDWSLPTSGGITQARKRLGFEPLQTLFERIAIPVATTFTPGAFVAGRRLVSMDGMVFDAPDTDQNAEEFGKPTGGAFPQVRVVTLTESASHVSLGAELGGVRGKGTGERTAARRLCSRLEQDMLLVCDQGFYGFDLWCAAHETGAELLWRVGDVMDLPVLQREPDGSYITLLFHPGTTKSLRARLIERALGGDTLAGEEDRVRWARVVEYTIDQRGSGELICLLTSILEPDQVPALDLAQAYHQRWQHEQANDEIKTHLRGPGTVLRSRDPDMVRQEIYGFLLAHNAVSSLICTAATETGLDPHRVKFAATVRIVREHIADPDAFSP
jgi:Insertion element 4 transposase N-terminal/Transposase DDE domain